MIDIKIEFTGNLKQMPTKGSKHAAGYDLYADVQHTNTITHIPPRLSERYKNPYIIIPANTTMLILTGFKVEIPVGYYIQVVARSGLALKQEITLGNAVGIIDSDYRGEFGVILRNESTTDFHVIHGDRIAQMVVAKLPEVNLIEGITNETKRGEGGFGSTGK